MVRVDGRLQHGSVINVAEGGLIIDFDCPGQRLQFVVYEHIFQEMYEHVFQRSDGRFTALYEAGAPVFVLLRRQLDKAWTWYVGTTVSLLGNGNFPEAALVEVQRPHITVRELVPGQQISRPYTEKNVHFVRVKAALSIRHGDEQDEKRLGSTDVFLDRLPRTA
ncbi:uncharacterized protein LOC129599058 isoform X2 [Paramacrobiotus metropolitanus]|uniref:uncharacterized protein LOC129599058 isoform X2 n=1 Tax=Paramacrobiotus metropolitanus TaxID=2943436 RepID=UPI00244592C9|nr:uncharacterized protein LOC129599058 isoform X2 [Paramacrobiotus metropolitanus]